MPLTPLEQQILQAKLKLSQEMPDVANTAISPIGPIGAYIVNARSRPDTSIQAFENPITGTISYNPTAMQGQSQSAIEDTLAHELTHARQTKREFGGKSLPARLLAYAKSLYTMPSFSYGQNPDELEAFQTEADRTSKESRIPTSLPNFSSPGFREGGDIRLLSPLQQALMDRRTRK